MMNFITQAFSTPSAKMDPYTYSSWAQPIGKLVGMSISLAVHRKATKLTFGMPPGIELTQESKAEMIERSADWTNSLKDYFCFRRRDGLPEVPLWLEIEGQWIEQIGIPAHVYPEVPHTLLELLVSLEKPNGVGSNVEWIEAIGLRAESNEREFVRIKLIIESNNSITVDLLESRLLPITTKVWWRNQRV